MLNEIQKCKITGVIGKTLTKKQTDGTKILESCVRIKLESSDIDYKAIEKFNPSISSTLLNIQPMPFVSVNFGEQKASYYNLMLRCTEENQLDNMPEFPDYEFTRVLIENLTIKVKENIPNYHFTIDILEDQINNKHLFNLLNKDLEFKLFECN